MLKERVKQWLIALGRVFSKERVKQWLFTLGRVFSAIGIALSFLALLFSFWYFRLRSPIWQDFEARIYDFFFDSGLALESLAQAQSQALSSQFLCILAIDCSIIMLGGFATLYFMNRVLPLD